MKRQKPRAADGFSLLENLLVIAISSTLIAAAMPDLRSFITRSEGESASRQLMHSWQYTRSQAVETQAKIYLCGSNDAITCSNQWQQQLLVFKDSNDNKQVDAGELLQQIDLDLQRGYFKSRLGLGKSGLYVNAQGNPSLTGSFIYCPDTGEANMIRRVTWSQTGRIYWAPDQDKDGITDDTDGSPMDANQDCG